MADMIGIKDLLFDPELAAASELRRAAPQVNAAAAGALANPDYLPDEEGYEIELPDGTPTRLRFCKQDGAFVAEYRVGNRDIPLPAKHKLDVAGPRVLDFFKKPHATIALNDEARKLMRAVQTLSEIKAKAAADASDANGAARWGAVPWKVGVIAGLLVAFDSLVEQAGVHKRNPVTQCIEVNRHLMSRAKSLCDVLEAMRTAWHSKGAFVMRATPTILGVVHPDVLAGILPGMTAPSGMAAFPATQPAAKRRRLAVVAGSAASSSSDAAEVAGAGGEDVQPPEEEVEEGSGAGDDSVPLVAKKLEDAISFDVGYGPAGVTAQASWKEPTLWMTDRDVMQRTVLKGRPVVKYNVFCDGPRREQTAANGVKKTLGFPKVIWEEIMAAGFAQFPVGKLVDSGTKDSRVEFSEPPTDTRERQVAYHNMLVDLCGVGARQFSTLLNSYVPRPAKPAAAPPAKAPAKAAAKAPGAAAAAGGAGAQPAHVPAP